MSQPIDTTELLYLEIQGNVELAQKLVKARRFNPNLEAEYQRLCDRIEDLIEVLNDTQVFIVEPPLLRENVAH